MSPRSHDAEAGHAHAHDHDAAPEPEADDRIRVLHGASPFCSWSFGYEPVLERLRFVYGEQVKVNTYQIPVYQSFEQWLQDYELDDASLREWLDEMDELIGLPSDRAYYARPTADCRPGTLLVHAAEAARPGAGQRLARRIGFEMYMQGRAHNDQDGLLRLAERAGAPRKEVEAALGDGRAEESLGTDAQSMHALGLNFYALQLRDAEGRTVILDHAFDPAKVEEALDWLGRGTLRKAPLPAPADYVAGHAPATLFEVCRVFRLDEAAARKAVEPAERAGRVVRREILGHTCWLPPER